MASDSSGTMTTEKKQDYSVTSGGGSVESGLSFQKNLSNATQAVTKTNDRPLADNIYKAP